VKKRNCGTLDVTEVVTTFIQVNDCQRGMNAYDNNTEDKVTLMVKFVDNHSVVLF